MLARLLRLLAVAGLVFITSFSVVAAPVAHAAIPEWAETVTKVKPKTLVSVGAKAAPARLITCGSVPGLIGCTAVAAGMFWLTETESGQNFADSVWDDVGHFFGKTTRTSNSCTGTVNADAWSAHQVALSVSIAGPGIPQGASPRIPCGTYMQGSPFAIGHVDCVQANGTLYRGTVRALYPDGGLVSACNLDASDWLIGVLVTESPTPGNGYVVGNPAYYKNPLWSGIPGASPTWWEDEVVKPDTRVTIKCRAASGTVTTVTKTVTGGDVDPSASCPAGTSIIGRAVDQLGFAGALLKSIYDVGVTPDAIANYPQCFNGSQTCDLGVRIDGTLCQYGAANCANWWELAQQTPGRVNCRFGPYTLGFEDCRELRYAYETPDGAWYPPDLPSWGFPPPITQDQAYRPPLSPASNPQWVTGSDCPPVSTSVSQYGLEPVALNGLRCFLRDHPDFSFTSGLRPYQHAGQISDHPMGLAIDLAPPNWNTTAGNQRGWDAAAYWIWNAPRLGVRYIIFDGSIWWPSTGWRIYADPDGNTDPHRDHVHVSFDPAAQPTTVRAPAPAPTLPYPKPSPTGEPSYPTNPNPTTGTPTTPTEPTPGFPTTGTNPADPDNCLSAAWTWNPADWVLVPTKCALSWAFVPSAPTLTQAQTTMTEAVTETGVPTWVTTAEAIPPAMSAPQTPTNGCMGPPMNLPDPFPTIYLFEACDGFRATMAGYTKTFMTVGLVVGTLLTTTTLIARGFGYDASAGSGSA